MIIYGLTDPRAFLIRYVGKTVDPAKRRRAHLQAARRGGSHRLARWIRKLLAEGVKPEMVLIEECDAASLDARERFHIARLRSEGFDLLNHTDGGDGGPTMKGKRFTAEHRRRISEALKGHAVSERSRRVSSELRRGKVVGRPFAKGNAPAHKVSLDDSDLFRLYVTEGLNSRAVAARLGCGQRPVLRRLRELRLTRPAILSP